jgi:hypothetical protein
VLRAERLEAEAPSCGGERRVELAGHERGGGGHLTMMPGGCRLAFLVRDLADGPFRNAPGGDMIERQRQERS